MVSGHFADSQPTDLDHRAVANTGKASSFTYRILELDEPWQKIPSITEADQV